MHKKMHKNIGYSPFGSIWIQLKARGDLYVYIYIYICSGRNAFASVAALCSGSVASLRHIASSCRSLIEMPIAMSVASPRPNKICVSSVQRCIEAVIYIYIYILFFFGGCVWMYRLDAYRSHEIIMEGRSLLFFKIAWSRNL